MTTIDRTNFLSLPQDSQSLTKTTKTESSSDECSPLDLLENESLIDEIESSPFTLKEPNANPMNPPSKASIKTIQDFVNTYEEVFWIGQQVGGSRSRIPYISFNLRTPPSFRSIKISCSSIFPPPPSIDIKEGQEIRDCFVLPDDKQGYMVVLNKGPKQKVTIHDGGSLYFIGTQALGKRNVRRVLLNEFQ